MELYLFNRKLDEKHPSVPVLVEIPGNGGWMTEHLTSSPGGGRKKPIVGDLGLLAEMAESTVRVHVGRDAENYDVSISYFPPSGDYYSEFYKDSFALSEKQKGEFERKIDKQFKVHWLEQRVPGA